ncbi:MAG: hypothetical protein HY067_14320 [Betaproteobacteria bacterium]|nr:hypothetical protein [Betaproteobacteria bacterium]
MTELFAHVINGLNVGSKLSARAFGSKLSQRRIGIEPELTHEEFRNRLTRLFKKAPDGVVKECCFLDFPASRPPWYQTDMGVQAGDRVTTMAIARTYLSRAPDAWIGSHFQLWMRVGAKGAILRGTGNTHSFVAMESGELRLASYFPDESSDQAGRLATLLEICSQVTGDLSIVVVRWNGSSLRGLRALANFGDVQGLVRTEINRLCNPVDLPD